MDGETEDEAPQLKMLPFLIGVIGAAGLLWSSYQMAEDRQERYLENRQQKASYMQLCMSETGSATECQSRWNLRLQPTGWN